MKKLFSIISHLQIHYHFKRDIQQMRGVDCENLVVMIVNSCNVRYSFPALATNILINEDFIHHCGCPKVTVIIRRTRSRCSLFMTKVAISKRKVETECFLWLYMDCISHYPMVISLNYTIGLRQKPSCKYLENRPYEYTTNRQKIQKYVHIV